MASGDLKLVYASSSDQTVTNLHSIATSSTYVNGWESGAIDNTSNLYTDYRITVKITVGTTLTAAQIRVFLAGMLDDSTWPGNLDGTESTEGPFFTDTEMQDAWMRLAGFTVTDTTNSDVYYIEIPSVAAVFGGNLPKKFVVCIAHATNANLAASGNQVTIVGSYANIVP